MGDSAEYLAEVFKHLVSKAIIEVGRDRLVRAATTSSAQANADRQRILEGCWTFLFDCFEPALHSSGFSLSRLSGLPPEFVRFELPDDLRGTRRVVSSIRLWLDYRDALTRARPILLGPRAIKTSSNKQKTIREKFPELAHERFTPPPTAASELALLVVARRHNLKPSTVKRKIASIPTNAAELLRTERAAFTGDRWVLAEIRRRLTGVVDETRAQPTTIESSPSPQQ